MDGPELNPAQVLAAEQETLCKEDRKEKSVVLISMDNQGPQCPLLTILNSLKSQIFHCPYRNCNVLSDLPPMSSSPLVV